ncbi:MAG: DUF5106 domain-containing protein [Chitinophagales bacterium]|nr:DUF5106 domain-containing protein [Chitinophagales bacterium]
MKLKKYLLLLILVFPLIISAQKTGYQIIVQVPTMMDTTCFLGRYYGDKQYIIDTVKSDKSGTAVFTGKNKLDGGLYLFVFPDKRYFEIIVDQEQYFSMETQWEDPIKNMKVKGSKDNELFYGYLNHAILLQHESADIQKKFTTAKTKSDSSVVYEELKLSEKKVQHSRDEYIKTYPTTFLAKVFTAMKEPVVPDEIPTLPNGRKDSTFAYRYYKSHYWDNIDFSDNRMLRTPFFGSKLNKYIRDLTVQVPDSINKEADYLCAKAKADSEMYKYVTWWITYSYETSKVMGMDAVFVHMVENYYMTQKAWWIDSATLDKMIDRARKIAPNLIGNTAPELALKDSSGNWQILSKVKARFTILLFWDPDCGHCQKEIPKVKEVYEANKEKGVAVYAVDIEPDPEKWKKFIREKKLDWINVNDAEHQSNFRQLYDIYSTPVIYILDEKKVIKAKRIGADQLEEVLTHFMNEKKS